MLSLNSHNQVVCGLSQVSRHLALFKSKKRAVGERRAAPAPASAAPPLSLCPESLAEAAQRCSGPLFADMQRALSSRHPSEHLSEACDSVSPWSVSHVSLHSFADNKRYGGWGRRYSPLASALRDALHLVDRQLARRVHVRGFKTDRSVVAEMDRNPSMWLRLKKSMGIGATKPGAVPSDIVSRIERIILNDEGQHIKPEDKDRVKIAFAEGYMAGASPENRKGAKTTKYLKLVQQFLTIIIFLAIFISLMTSASGSAFRIQLGNQVEVDPEEISVTFEDVKGADEAKQELKDVVEFLKSPDKFSSLGGKLPKGVLLVGPPGTGKTLLARAVAGEAGVPFFHAAGPEFDEVLVGQGARRVRDLFKAAKERAPCVVFIDEIDSVGAKRTNSILHPYANQTINQLLSEMDGFHQNEGVIVLGATNRRDDLDPALLRPGRFDVEVNVPTPDYSGRKDILHMYLERILVNTDVDVELLARGTTGFTGADLENLVNQAALKAAMDGAKTVTMKYLEAARDKVLMGPERKSRLPDEEANLITAYHEGGHAVVAYFTKESHPLHKVTIIPRGPSLGHTAYIPASERYHVTKQQLLAMIDTMMGGRAAEELIFGPDKITSGASSDLKQATSIASNMVRDWGMSEKVGLRTLESSRGAFTSGETLGPNTNEAVDVEIKRILTESYERAKSILKTHSKEHKALAEALMKYETLNAQDIKAIMAGEKPLGESAPVRSKETIPTPVTPVPAVVGPVPA
ncbi:ATP-dependent zinc metalloprotease YME1L [Arctopsyche grandis]|uniref:ATP-dependent zinc metalloprotease YME1L n=1 Tax=Arctopsyche grandis TaxID=121162 RepID=UPI00406D827E